MAFIYCRNCEWGQDDFWDPNGYNPFLQDIIDLKRDLFKDKIYLDKWLFEDMDLPYDGKDEKGYYVNGRAYVAKELERKAKSIRNMAFPTEADWKKGDVPCPKCGKKDWSVD